MLVVRPALVLAAALAAAPLHAGVLVVGNFTPAAVTLTVTDSPKETRAVTLAPFQVSPIAVGGPVNVSFPAAGGTRTIQLEPSNAYALVVDPADGRRIAGVALPGNPLPEDEKAGDAPPAKTTPLRIPVTLLVDDLDPRTERVWQAAVRKRFDAAAAAIEEASGVRFEVDGYATWPHDPAAFDFLGVLEDFEKKVPAKAGRVYVGFTSRRYDDKKDVPFGQTRGVLASHVLMREWRPTAEPLRVEALVRTLAQVVGAVPSPDPGSVMRPNPDNLALRADHRTRFDPLNALAMSLWADELRKGARATPADVSPANKARLARVYRALAEAMPDDRRAGNYLNELENGAVARRPDGPGPNGNGVEPAPARPGPSPLAGGRDGVQGGIRTVLRAVTTRARLNAGLPDKADDGGLPRLVGDPLTAAYVQAAAEAAAGVDDAFRATAFLVGLGLALDDAGLLRDDPLTGPLVKGVESDAERQERLAVIGVPTARGRRDLLQRFAVAAATADLVGATAAFEGGVSRSLFDLHKPVGFGFPAVAADLAGAAFAEGVKADLGAVEKYRRRFRMADVVLPPDELRDGLGADRFEQDFGAADDPRFKAVVDGIRKRLDGLPGYERK